MWEAPSKIGHGPRGNRLGQGNRVSVELQKIPGGGGIRLGRKKTAGFTVL